MISENTAKAHSQNIEKESDQKNNISNNEDLSVFSSATSIIKDLKNKNTFDIIRIKEQIDTKPLTFDFGSGIVLVYTFLVEVVDAELHLYIPALNSFLKKIEVGKFYRIHSKRSFHYEIFEDKINKWILYVNRIKNISLYTTSIKQRMEWKLRDRTKPIQFGFDENWLEKSLPIDNNLEQTKKFLETPNDINRDNMLSPPLKVMRLEFIQQLEFVEKSGSIIKNLEYSALLHNNKVVKLYIPYFLKDIITHLSENLLSMNIIINRLKLFQRKESIGFLWDCTLSGFIFTPKAYEEKLMSIKDGIEFFFGPESEEFHKFIWKKKQIQNTGYEKKSNHRGRHRNRGNRKYYK